MLEEVLETYFHQETQERRGGGGRFGEGIQVLKSCTRNKAS